jgi:hypothetical protein
MRDDKSVKKTIEAGVLLRKMPGRLGRKPLRFRKMEIVRPSWTKNEKGVLRKRETSKTALSGERTSEVHKPKRAYGPDPN